MDFGGLHQVHLFQTASLKQPKCYLLPRQIKKSRAHECLQKNLLEARFQGGWRMF